MYINVISLIFLLISILIIRKEKNFLNPVSTLFGIWGIILLFSNLKLYTLYSVSNTIYFMIALGLLSFLAGYYSFRFLFNKKNVVLSISKKNKNSYIIRKRTCYILLIICIMYLLIMLYANRNLIFQYGYNLASVQRSLLENTTSKSGILNAIGFLFINPLYLALTIVIVINYFYFQDRSNYRLMLILLLIMSLLRVITTGGRQAVIQVLLSVLVGISFSKNNMLEKIKNFKLQKKNIRIILLGIVVLFILTLSRTKSVIKSIYLDFAMQPYMMEYWIKIVEQEQIYGYGLSSLMGFIYPIFYVFKNLFPFWGNIPLYISKIYSLNNGTMENWIKIGTDLSANAYVSWFWYLFLDGRLLGILIGMYLIGLISYNTYTKAKYSYSFKSIIKYCYIFIIIVYSFGDMELSKTSFALSILYALFILIKRQSKMGENI